MTESNDKQQSGIKDLIAKGREQGYLTYAEVNDHLPEDIADPEQVEDIIQMINDMGITVFETAPDAETLLMMNGDNTPDEVAAAEAAAALASVESEQHRQLTPCVCTCVRWVLLNCLPGKARSRLPSVLKKALVSSCLPSQIGRLTLLLEWASGTQLLPATRS